MVKANLPGIPAALPPCGIKVQNCNRVSMPQHLGHALGHGWQGMNASDILRTRPGNNVLEPRKLPTVLSMTSRTWSGAAGADQASVCLDVAFRLFVALLNKTSLSSRHFESCKTELRAAFEPRGRAVARKEESRADLELCLWRMFRLSSSSFGSLLANSAPLWPGRWGRWGRWASYRSFTDRNLSRHEQPHEEPHEQEQQDRSTTGGTGISLSKLLRCRFRISELRRCPASYIDAQQHTAMSCQYVMEAVRCCDAASSDP